MLSVWVELGLDPPLFWTLTPRVMHCIADAARRRLDHQHNERAWLAWNTAALHRARRMPRMQSLMVKPRSRKRQTWKDQMIIFRSITAAHGGSIH